MRPVIALLWKDILLELRSRDIVVSVLVFALLVVITFNFAIDPTPQLVAVVAPGILWVSFTFGGVLGFSRSFASEKEHGNINGLLLAPVGREAIFFGKMLGSLLFMLVVEVLVYPVFAVLYNLPLVIPALLPVALLATLGVATVGTLFAAMAVNTRSREVMLPVLFFPVIMPVLVAAVESTGALLASDASALTRWLPFLAVYDLIFLVACPLAFGMVAEE